MYVVIREPKEEIISYGAVIHRDKANLPTVVHGSFESARAEAERLAKGNVGVKFYVCRFPKVESIVATPQKPVDPCLVRQRFDE